MMNEEIDNILTISSIVNGIEYEVNKKKGNGAAVVYLKGGHYIGDVYIWDDGSWYFGDTINNYAHGFGIFVETIVSGTALYMKYVGEFKDGQFNGKGVLRNVDGEHYKGEFVKGWRHGKGVTYFNNGIIENGNYIYGCPDGWCKHIYGKKRGGRQGYTIYYNMGNIKQYGEFL